MLGIKSLNLRRRYVKVKILSKGIVIFAYVTGPIDYFHIADIAAGLAKRHLDLPVTLITNIARPPKYADNVILTETPETRDYRTFGDLKTEWLNGNRASVYDLTPYDQTLMIDADYFIMNNQLMKLFDTDLEFACYDKVCDVTGNAAFEQAHLRLANTSIPMVWATVVYFTKGELSEAVFKFMDTIRQNWEFYSTLYGFSSTLYRNDYALSIALQALTGFSVGNFSTIPGKLLTANTDAFIFDVKPNKFVITTEYYGLDQIVGESVHFMNKQNLMTDLVQTSLESLLNAKT